MALFEHYRRGAGRKARSFATIVLLALLVWLCYALLEYGNTRVDRLVGFEDAFFGKTLVGGGGALTEWMTWSLVFVLGFFVAGLITLRWYLNRPAFADLLIATEAELRRVRWAARKEVIRATNVVLYFVFWFAMIMFVYDLTFSMAIGLMQRQDWKQVGWGRVVTMVLRLDPPVEPGSKNEPTQP